MDGVTVASERENGRIRGPGEAAAGRREAPRAPSAGRRPEVGGQRGEALAELRAAALDLLSIARSLAEVRCLLG